MPLSSLPLLPRKPQNQAPQQTQNSPPPPPPSPTSSSSSSSQSPSSSSSSSSSSFFSAKTATQKLRKGSLDSKFSDCQHEQIEAIDEYACLEQCGKLLEDAVRSLFLFSRSVAVAAKLSMQLQEQNFSDQRSGRGGSVFLCFSGRGFGIESGRCKRFGYS